MAAGRIAIEDGRIAAVELDEAEAAGPLIAPGSSTSMSTAGAATPRWAMPDDLDGMARALLRHGVTSFLPTAVPRRWPSSARVRRRASGLDPGRAGRRRRSARVQPRRSVHLAARKGRARSGGNPRGHAKVAETSSRSSTGSGSSTIAPEIPGALELIGWLARARRPVSIGHSAATFRARAGYAAGGRSTTHLFNAMTGVDHRAPGLAVAALIATTPSSSSSPTATTSTRRCGRSSCGPSPPTG